MASTAILDLGVKLVPKHKIHHFIRSVMTNFVTKDNSLSFWSIFHLRFPREVAIPLTDFLQVRLRKPNLRILPVISFKSFAAILKKKKFWVAPYLR